MVAVAALVVVGSVVALTRGGSGDSAGRATTTSSPATTSTTVAPVPFPALGSLVSPGFYVTSRFQPRFTATLADEWKLNVETEQDIELEDPPAGPGLLSVLTAGHPLDRNQVFATPEQTNQPSSTEAPTDDAIGWLRSHRDLSVTPSSPATLLGGSGVQVEVTVVAGHGTAACTPRPCIPLFHVGDNNFFSLREGIVNRVYAVRAGEVEILVVIEAPTEFFGAFAEKAERVIGTMNLAGGGGEATPGSATTVPPVVTTSKGGPPPVVVTTRPPSPTNPPPTNPPPPPPTPAPTTAPPATVVHTFPQSPDGRFRAVSTGINYQVVNQATNGVVLTTIDEFGQVNEVQFAAFSPDSGQFGAAYHYGHDGGYTWIGYWSTASGTRVSFRKLPGLRQPEEGIPF